MESDNLSLPPTDLLIPNQPIMQRERANIPNIKSPRTISRLDVFESPENMKPDQRIFFPGEYAPNIIFTIVNINAHKPNNIDDADKGILGLFREDFQSVALPFIVPCELLS